MILVDSSVWVDYFNGIDTRQTGRLDELLGSEPIGVGDLILTEVLQGFRSDTDYRAARRLLTGLDVFNMLNTGLAIKSADNFRKLRKQGITVRKTVDMIITTFCIEQGHALLFSDRDFLPMVEYMGLAQVA